MDEFKVFDFGFSMARVKRAINPSMVIVTPSVADNGLYEPAQSIGLYRRADIEALRDACDFALGKGEKA